MQLPCFRRFAQRIVCNFVYSALFQTLVLFQIPCPPVLVMRLCRSERINGNHAGSLAGLVEGAGT
jgi:hypothetical protein